MPERGGPGRGRLFLTALGAREQHRAGSDPMGVDGLAIALSHAAVANCASVLLPPCLVHSRDAGVA